MLTVKMICIGSLKESYWREACGEYAKRLSAFCRFTILELPESRLPQNPSPALIAKALAEEEREILSALGNSKAIPLCIEGKAISSQGLSALLEGCALHGDSSVAFIIGSSYGLSPVVKQLGSPGISMSSMTFPHQLARVMLCEQLYRAFGIGANTRYHK